MSSTARDEGFGLVELVIAMFLLGIITLALIPALYGGLVQSSKESTTATATRQLNAMIETAREESTCDAVTAATQARSFVDGAKQAYSTSGTYDCGTNPASLTLTAKDAKGQTIATADALVFLK